MINLQIPHATTIRALRARVKSWREAGETVGFVPTMGALHDGHLALVRLARAHCDRVVTSIFVNPAQFGQGEDLATYPRDGVEDASKLAKERCDLIYVPDREIMYPDHYTTMLTLEGPALGLESDFRPHFFGGVATVVAKLFNQVRPDVAVFGEKDYQQLLVIRQMVKDLDFDLDIIAGETIREADGLAMSSRNAYLNDDQRQRAGKLNEILKSFGGALHSGADLTEAQAMAMTAAQDVFDGVDYVQARCATTLQSFDAGKVTGPARVLAAVRLGDARLIDNCAVPAS
ncbi:MAG: pantoate--beta-alanine ligase [Maricaulis sp.]|jgi:pantoate--beta-alanine ligase|nr:pantoate--beta-alanine ligase [Maricaulis sp.]MDG2045510.1 pantoate--beta-alanine ligase [Maricaulis sp.]